MPKIIKEIRQITDFGNKRTWIFEQVILGFCKIFSFQVDTSISRITEEVYFNRTLIVVMYTPILIKLTANFGSDSNDYVKFPESIDVSHWIFKVSCGGLRRTTYMLSSSAADVTNSLYCWRNCLAWEIGKTIKPCVVDLDIAKLDATGEVYPLKYLSDFAVTYVPAGASIVVAGGAA